MRNRTKIHAALNILRLHQERHIQEAPGVMNNAQVLPESNDVTLRPNSGHRSSMMRMPLSPHRNEDMDSVLKNGRQITPSQGLITERAVVEQPCEPEQEPILLGKEFVLQGQPKRNVFSQLMIVSHIKKFVRKLLEFRTLTNLHLNKDQLVMINDASADDPEALGTVEYISMNQVYLSRKKRTKNTIWSKLSKQITRLYHRILRLSPLIACSNLLDKVPILSPHSAQKNAWDIMMLVIKGYLMLLLPVEVCFLNGILFGVSNPITTFFCVLLILDFVIMINTGYYKFGQLTKTRKSATFINLVEITATGLLSINSLLSYDKDYVTEHTLLKFFSLFFYVQLSSLLQYKDKLEDNINWKKQWISIYRIIKLILTIFFVEHLAACLWYLIGDFGKSAFPERNWIEKYGYENLPYSRLYLESIYFNVVTMITVGYGDLTPQNELEKIFCIFFMVFSSIQLSYVLSTVGAILIEFSEQTDKIRRKIKIINKYMKKKNIKKSLQQQIREYLYYFWEQQDQQEMKEEEEIIGQLSHQLQQNLTIETNSHILRKIPIFKDDFSSNLRKSLSKLMKTVVAYPEDIIELTHFKDLTGPILYFIESGEVQEYVQGDGVQVKTSMVRSLKEGDYFGCFEFFSETQPHTKFKSVGFSKLAVVRKADFLGVINDLPRDRELYQKINHRITILHQLECLKTYCGSCYSYDHLTHTCPMIHYAVDREKIIKKHSYHSLQIRKVYHRKGRAQHYDATGDLDTINEAAENWRVDNAALIAQYDIQEDQDEAPTPMSQSASSHQLKGMFNFLQIKKSVLRTDHTPNLKSNNLHIQINADDDDSPVRRGRKNLLQNYNNTQDLLNSPHHWFKILQKRLKTATNTKDHDDCWFMTLFLRLKLGPTVEDGFEALRDWEIFQPQNNFTAIHDAYLLQALRKRYKSHKYGSMESTTADPHEHDVWNLTKYLIFPHDFLSRYREQIRSLGMTDDDFTRAQRKEQRRKTSRRKSRRVSMIKVK